jgi:hypothetical protein
LEPKANDTFEALSPAAGGKLHRRCANSRDREVCNWLVPVEDPNPLCLACRLNVTIPDLAVPGNLDRWAKMEIAKRRAIHTLLRLDLPREASENRLPLRFQFLAESSPESPVLTGHASGLITINIAEADDDERERRRISLHEPFRTLLGHFRHELGHYYWDRLIANTARLGRFRDLFGDESQDYPNALRVHYEQGPPPDWQARFVSAYSAAHPWEDWAESWAHYFHMIDAVETARSYGLSLRPRHTTARALSFEPAGFSDLPEDFSTLVSNWIPLTHALNSLNRGMGLSDLYPFILSAPALEKLHFVHDVAREGEDSNR